MSSLMTALAATLPPMSPMDPDPRSFVRTYTPVPDAIDDAPTTKTGTNTWAILSDLREWVATHSPGEDARVDWDALDGAGTVVWTGYEMAQVTDETGCTYWTSISVTESASTLTEARERLGY